MVKKVFIHGSGRTEIAEIKGKDRMLNFFLTRNQLYEVFPEYFKPMMVYDDFGFLRIDSEISYSENAIRPYGTGPCAYNPMIEGDWMRDRHSFDWKCARLTEQIFNTTGSLREKLGAKYYFTQMRSAGKEIMASGVIGFLILGIALLQGFLG